MTAIIKPHMNKYKIINDYDGNESFSIEALTLEDAAVEALEQLGWWVADEKKED
jgi:hypothetical protein